MAVDDNNSVSISKGRRFMVGTNVLMTLLMAGGIAAILQAIAFSMSTARVDMTSTRLNSLSEASQNLLHGLDTNIRLTSLYFELDLEEGDQPRYRQAAQNLLDLYEATNRAKVTADWINPLKDHGKLSELKQRLQEKAAFKGQVDAAKARIDEYTNTLDGQFRTLVQSELDAIANLSGGLAGGSASATGPVETLFRGLAANLEQTRERVDTLVSPENQQYSAAINEMSKLYRQVGDSFKNVGEFGKTQGQAAAGSEAEAAFLREAGSRYASIVAAIEAERTKIEELEPLKLDDILRELAPTANAILVETDDDARVVTFSSVWPPLDERAGGRAKFDQRAFKGEEKLTSAILRTTHKEQTAVVFVRFGGAPLFGSPIPGQQPGLYTALKAQLEDVNFVVQEWDLQTVRTPPAIDPAPTRTIYIVLNPQEPPRGRMGQPGPKPPLGNIERKALIDALGENGRALFIVGWEPGSMGPFPSAYEFSDYLKKDWGIEVESNSLLISATNIGPGKYAITRRDFSTMSQVEVSDHDIVSNASARQLGLPSCAPLKLLTPPEGVEQFKLVTQPKQDGVWGVKNLQAYADQTAEQQYLSKIESDLEGPFDLAVAAVKGDAKIVVVSSRNFAEDRVAMASYMAMEANRLVIRNANPGNITLVINSLHWLNDNTKFMNIGKPIEASVLEIKKESTEKIVQAITIFVWPALALCFGGVTWWVRRR